MNAAEGLGGASILSFRCVQIPMAQNKALCGDRFLGIGPITEISLPITKTGYIWDSAAGGLRKGCRRTSDGSHWMKETIFVASSRNRLILMKC